MIDCRGHGVPVLFRNRGPSGRLSMSFRVSATSGSLRKMTRFLPFCFLLFFERASVYVPFSRSTSAAITLHTSENGRAPVCSSAST